jgi:hypothetical protein
MPKSLLKKHAVAKNMKEQGSETWRTFGSENEMNVVEVEAVEEVAVPFIPGAQALQGPHDGEIHRAGGHRQGATSIPTFRPEEATDELAQKAGRVHDQFRVQSQGLLRGRDLQSHTAKRLGPAVGQDLSLTQGRQTSKERDCRAVPFRQ